ncbi:TPA: hypothetical protein ACXJGQ_000124 [Serratia marcescens]
MDKFSELKATVPVNVKNREAVSAGFVTHDNTGGYFVIECQECGAVYPSQQADGGGQIADTGDYDDAICPHCGEESPEECENVGLAWNVQQAKITVLLAELEAKDKRIAELEQRLATPVRLPERYSVDCGVCADPNGEWLSHNDVIATLFTAGFTVERDE